VPINRSYHHPRQEVLVKHQASTRNIISTQGSTRSVQKSVDSRDTSTEVGTEIGTEQRTITDHDNEASSGVARRGGADDGARELRGDLCQARWPRVGGVVSPQKRGRGARSGTKRDREERPGNAIGIERGKVRERDRIFGEKVLAGD
jgi:hypothetical protein